MSERAKTKMKIASLDSIICIITGGQLDGNFLPGSLPHKFIILIVTSFICLWWINLSLFLGHATGGARVGHVEACGSGLLRHGLNASTAWCTTRRNSVEKDWKHVIMRPHISTSSFQSHRRQPTNGSFQRFQRLKERNKPSVRWKSFAIHKLLCWHFQVGGQVDYRLDSCEIT